MPLEIVPVEKIPSKEQIQAVPLDELPKVYKVCTQLRELCNRSGGIGISAVQAGIPWKLFLVKSGGRYRYFLNCEYSPDGEQMLCVEGCLSLKRKNKLRSFQLQRYRQVKIDGFELLDTGTELELVPLKDYIVKEFEGTIFQHEIDHHFGILISDIGEEIELRYG
jgi:peptide deformylase